LEDYDSNKQYICHVVLIDDQTLDFKNMIAKPDRWNLDFEKLKRYKVFDCLVGSTSIIGAQLHDTNEKAGVFFIFPDLSIRAQGFYRLLCTVVDLQEYHELSLGQVNV
jgi:hypothetical protein